MRCVCIVQCMSISAHHRPPHISSPERHYYQLWKQRSGWGRSVEMLRHWQWGERTIECAIVAWHSASTLCDRLFRGTEKLLFSRAQLVSLVSQAYNGERWDISEAQAHVRGWKFHFHTSSKLRELLIACLILVALKIWPPRTSRHPSRKGSRIGINKRDTAFTQSSGSSSDLQWRCTLVTTRRGPDGRITLLSLGFMSTFMY